MTVFFAAITRLVYAQSGSTGSTFVHSGGQMGLFGQHNFQNGSGTISAGIIGSERQPSIGMYTFVNPSGTWIGASDQAFVDGYVRTLQSGPFTFPIGDNNKYRPAAVSASSSAAPTTAAYYGVDPGTATTSDLKGGAYGILPGGSTFPTTSKDVGIGTVDNIEYWDIDGTTPARITLTWDVATPITSMVGTNLGKLKIVGWDGAKWVIIPSTVDAGSLVQNTSTSAFTGLPGAVSAGSITTDATVVPGLFTVYTLAGIEIVCNLTVTAVASQTAVCVGGTVSLSASVSPAGSYTYAWSGSNGFVSNLQNPTVTNIQAGVDAGAALYTVSVTDAAGCTAVQTTAISVQTPNVTVSSNSPQCAGNTLTFSATGGMTSYAWTGPNGFASNQQNPTIPNTTTLATGTYTLAVISPTGCMASFVTSATIATQPSLTVTGSPGLTICSGQSTTLAVSGNNGSLVTWANSLGQTGTGNSISFAGIRNLSTQPQSITYVIEATAGSCTDTKIVVVTITPEPVLQVVPSAAIYCDIEQVSVSATVLPATATINWIRTPSTPGTASGSGVGTVTILDPVPAANYVYTFTATGINGCASGSVSIPVTVQQ